MANNKMFWLAGMAGLLAFYGVALVLAVNAGFAPRPVKVALIVLAAHALEIPVAFRQLASRKPQPLRVVVATLVFGLLWWIPARRGLFAVA